jgi:hypothetical protein
MPRRGHDRLAKHARIPAWRLARWWSVASVEIAELGDVLVGAVAVDFDLGQLRLDPT